MFDVLPDPGAVQPRWEPPLDSKGGADEYRVKFTVDADEYVIGFYRVPTVGVPTYYVFWGLNRRPRYLQWVIRWFFTKLLRGGQPDRTDLAKERGLGYTIRVLASVFSLIAEFSRKVHPSIFCFDQTDPKVGQFNAEAAAKLAPHFGYRYEEGGLIVRADQINRPGVRRAMQQHRDGKTPFTPK